MRKALITGSEGFVGGYLKKELSDNGYDVYGADVVVSEEAEKSGKVFKIDMLDYESTFSIIDKIKPDIIIHLAGQANVAASWKIPQKTMQINVIAAINLMEAVRNVNSDIRIVLVGSSDQYGKLLEKGVDVKESMETHPETPYAVSKKAQEEMAGIYVRAYKMNVCMTRSFNHGGAGQKKGFMIPDFASGIVDVERGNQDVVRVGNLESKRDFTHVKDVVRAYRLIAEKGKTGTVYNVGSGTAVSAASILDKLVSMADCEIKVVQDPSRLRPSDTPVICCNHDLLTEDTGWTPLYSVDDIVKDTLDYYRKQN